jgi:hypothetical protein
MSLLVVFGGLPATGKTTLARERARRMAATHLRIDTIEQALKAAGLAVGPMGYVIANALAADNLILGRADMTASWFGIPGAAHAARPPAKPRFTRIIFRAVLATQDPVAHEELAELHFLRGARASACRG